MGAVELLLDSKAEVIAKNNKRRTRLHWSATEGHRAVAE
jgi:ankyrin repeat protein